MLINLSGCQRTYPRGPAKVQMAGKGLAKGRMSPSNLKLIIQWINKTKSVHFLNIFMK